MVAMVVLGVVLVSLIVALIVGKVPGVGEDYGTGFFVWRSHNPFLYWFEIVGMAICAIIAGLTVAANYGVYIVPPNFKL